MSTQIVNYFSPKNVLKYTKLGLLWIFKFLMYGIVNTENFKNIKIHNLFFQIKIRIDPDRQLKTNTTWTLTNLAHLLNYWILFPVVEKTESLEMQMKMTILQYNILESGKQTIFSIKLGLFFSISELLTKLCTIYLVNIQQQKYCKYFFLFFMGWGEQKRI